MASRRADERGAALLTVLMLVAVIAVMAGAALEKLRLSTRLAANAAAADQARAYAIGAEAMATVRLGDLLTKSEGRVTLLGNWSDRPFPLPLPGGGMAVARVVDGGNCFNLNGLATSAGAPGLYQTAGLQRIQFARLMRLLGISGQVADQIAASTADWIDSDQDQQPGGAEDSFYTGQQTGYRTAGTLMADVSELRAVSGVTPEVYARLRPWVCALPVAEPSRMNVNTILPEQAPLLAMLAPDGSQSVDSVRALLLRRPPQGWSNALDLWKGATTPSDAAAQTAATTAWFRMTVDVTVPGAQLQERALIDASRLPVRLVARQWGEDT